MKVEIVGTSATSSAYAPYSDTTWQKWGMAQHAFPQADLLIEMHTWQEAKEWPKEYKDFLLSTPNLYMSPCQADKYNAKPYPINELPHRYIGSSIDYLMALAIIRGADTIGVWGVDMAHDEEYFYQRPSFEFWRGYAMAQGIDVIVPEHSPLTIPDTLYGTYDNRERLQSEHELRKSQRQEWRDRIVAACFEKAQQAGKHTPDYYNMLGCVEAFKFEKEADKLQARGQDLTKTGCVQ